MGGLKSFFSKLSSWSCFSNDTDHDSPTVQTISRIKQPSKDSPPTSLIVSHGAFITQYHYQTFSDFVRKSCTFDRCLVPQQTSSGPSPPPNSFEIDVEHLHETVRTELLDGRDVLLVCHSYGGIPGCEALADLPEKAIEGSTKRLGRVLGIVFVCAFVAEAGQSLVTSKLGERADWVRTDGALSYALNPAATLFSLLTPAAAAPLVAHLVPQATASFLATTKHATWKQFPCYYVRDAQDRAMLPAEQDFFIERLKKGQPRGGVKDLEADHVPFASVPERLVGVVEEIVGELRWQE